MVASTTAARHAAATRKGILDAAAELFLARHGDDFSVQEVADRADLTHRTVYRYFPTRQALLAATAQHIAPGGGDDPFRDVASVGEWLEAARKHLAGAEGRLPLIRSMIAATIASPDASLLTQVPRDRDLHLWEVFRREFPRLADEDARQTFVAVRQLLSQISYTFFRVRFGLAPGAALETTLAGAQQLLQQAALRNDADPMGARDGH